MPPVYVSWYWRSTLRKGTVFLLSNGAAQMNFEDGTKLVLVPWWPVPRVRPIDAADTSVLALRPDTPVPSSCAPQHLSPYVKELCLFLLTLRQRLDSRKAHTAGRAKPEQTTAAEPPQQQPQQAHEQKAMDVGVVVARL